MTRWWIALGVMFILGAVLAAVGGTTLDVIGICLGGFAAVGALSLAFFAVGRGEDRARAEEEAARRESAPPNGDGGWTRRGCPGGASIGARGSAGTSTAGIEEGCAVPWRPIGTL